MDPHCTWRLVLSFSNVEMGNGFKHLNIFKHRDVQICGLSCRKSMKMQGRELSYLKMCDSYQASFSSQMARLPNFAELSAAGINFGCPGHPVPSSHVSSPERPSLLRSSMGLLWEGQGKGLFCIKKLWLLPERNGNKNVSGHFRNSQVLLCTPWRPTNLICSGYFYAILETVMVWVTSVLKYYTRLLCFSSVPQQRYQGKAESFVVTVSSMLADAHFASVTFCKSLHPSAAVLPHKTRAKKTLPRPRNSYWGQMLLVSERVRCHQDGEPSKWWVAVTPWLHQDGAAELGAAMKLYQSWLETKLTQITWVLWQFLYWSYCLSSQSATAETQLNAICRELLLQWESSDLQR